MTIIHKVPDCKGILVRASAGESLVGHVKEDQEFAVLYNPGKQEGGRCHPKKGAEIVLVKAMIFK